MCISHESGHCKIKILAVLPAINQVVQNLFHFLNALRGLDCLVDLWRTPLLPLMWSFNLAFLYTRKDVDLFLTELADACVETRHAGSCTTGMHQRNCVPRSGSSDPVQNNRRQLLYIAHDRSKHLISSEGLMELAGPLH